MILGGIILVLKLRKRFVSQCLSLSNVCHKIAESLPINRFYFLHNLIEVTILVAVIVLCAVVINIILSMELMSGDTVTNKNKAGNMLRSRFYVCPLCGNILHTTGDAVISCCGITLPPLESEETDGEHWFTMEKVEDEYFLTVNHEMTKTHYISFAAYITSDRLQLVKFYP